MAAAASACADAEGIDIPFTGSARTMDYELLKALQKGDVTVVRRFLSQETVSSEAIDHAVAFERLEVGRRSWRGVTVGGNSALHIVADFGHLELAKQICARDSSLLTASNVAGETPLHCAVRTGADQIVSLFISVGRQDGGCRLEEVLRATDREGKTALHAAAQKGHAEAAKVLMSADPGLAAIVDSKGVSPLYLAVLLGSLEIVQILIGSCADGGDTPEASYAGPNGQTALHAAVMIKSPEIAENLLQWKSILTKKVDNSKSSPLHYLATTSNHYMVRQLLKHDTSPAYFSDSKGLCPIHVAAMMRKTTIISELINSCPDMFELVDGRERNFLHVAIQHKQDEIVKFVCGQKLLLKMMNARDSEGNTPLHLAVKSKNKTIVSLLLKNKSVEPSIENQNGKTPLDLATAGLEVGLNLGMNPSIWISHCLKVIGAIHGPHRSNQLVDEMTTKLDQEKELKNQEKELKKYDTTIQSLAVGSVLIATVTFAAAFTMPGGYKADDHQNGGTPTLATKYAFKAFIFSDSLAFIFSIMATILLMYAGSLTADPSLQMEFILYSAYFLDAAAQAVVIAFTMAVYVVLAPVNIRIAISICALSSNFVVFFSSPDIWQAYRLTRILKSRLGWLKMHKIFVTSRPGIEDDGGNIYNSIFLHVTLYFVIYFSVSLESFAK